MNKIINLITYQMNNINNYRINIIMILIMINNNNLVIDIIYFHNNIIQNNINKLEISY